MYAVIQTGGKQVQATLGQTIQIEKIEGELGAQIHFDQVLLVRSSESESGSVEIGRPFLEGIQVRGEIIGQGRDEKILIIKMKRRKQYRRTQGHRQEQTQVLITGILSKTGWKEISQAERDKAHSSFMSQLKPKGPTQHEQAIINRAKLVEKKQARVQV